MATDIKNTGTFVDSAEARKNVQSYLNDAGHVQHKHDHPDHVFGHIFGLAKVKKLIANIDKHNANEKDAKKHIAGVRIYHAKSVRPGKEHHGSMRDLVVVPVTKKGNDYPEPIHHKEGTGAQAEKVTKSKSPMILTASGPCPNVCGGS